MQPTVFGLVHHVPRKPFTLLFKNCSMASAPTSTKNETQTTRQVRSIGFSKSGSSGVLASSSGQQTNQPLATTPAAASSRAPIGPRKRPKGRLFIGCLLLSVISGLGYIFWNEFVRYAAYGSIEARVVSVAAPWTGIIEAIEVEDGQYVRQDQLLAKIDSAELKIRLAKLEDDIRLAEATLATRNSELETRRREVAIDRLRSQSEFDQLQSQLHTERAKLAELSAQNQAISKLEYNGVVADVEASQSHAALLGQQRKVQALEQAMARYASGLESLPTTLPGEEHLLLDQQRIESLMDERRKLLDYQRLGEIRSPVSGRIIRSDRNQGEFIELSTELFQIVKEGSLRAVLYVPQSQAEMYPPQRSVKLLIPPSSAPVQFLVERIDDQAIAPPNNLSRYFRKDEKVIAVITRPSDSTLDLSTPGRQLWLGAEVRLPHSLKLLAPSQTIVTTAQSIQRFSTIVRSSLP